MRKFYIEVPDGKTMIVDAVDEIAARHQAHTITGFAGAMLSVWRMVQRALISEKREGKRTVRRWRVYR